MCRDSFPRPHSRRPQRQHGLIHSFCGRVTGRLRRANPERGSVLVTPATSGQQGRGSRRPRLRSGSNVGRQDTMQVSGPSSNPPRRLPADTRPPTLLIQPVRPSLLGNAGGVSPCGASPHGQRRAGAGSDQLTRPQLAGFLQASCYQTQPLLNTETHDLTVKEIIIKTKVTSTPRASLPNHSATCVCHLCS